MEQKILIPRLMSEFKYPEQGAKVVAEKLTRLSPQVEAAFEHWWANGSLQSPEIQGYTVTRLMEEHNMKPIAAFLTLDWLTREPEKALASLRKGHDKVS